MSVTGIDAELILNRAAMRVRSGMSWRARAGLGRTRRRRVSWSGGVNSAASAMAMASSWSTYVLRVSGVKGTTML